MGVAGMPECVRLIAAVAGSFTYASFQNAIPVIRSIAIENATRSHFETCRLTMTSAPVFLRPKVRIRERLEPHTLAYERTSESVGDFLWLNGTVAPAIPHRPVTDEAFRRSVTEIPLPELAGLVLSTSSLGSAPDPALALARLLGVGRLAATSRSRLEEAIGYAHRLGAGL
jgi:hypothetical protein